MDLDIETSTPLVKKNDYNTIPIFPKLRKLVRKLTPFKSTSIIARTVNKLNNQKKVPPLNPETYNELMLRYKDDLDKLYSLTGINFK